MGSIEEKSVDHVDVLIIGAGPAGLMMAMWMSRCGIRTRIVDKRGTKVFSFNPTPTPTSPLLSPSLNYSH